MQLKKIGYGAFLCAAALVCVLPAAASLWRQDEAVGNERLASAPLLVDADGAFNADFLSDFSSYFADHFGYRHEMITANDTALGGVFGTLDSDSVLLGEDGWLFYRATEADYTGANLFSARQSWAAAHTLALMQEYCQQNGIDFCFTIAPNKNSLYGDKMPERYPAAATRNAQLVGAELDAQGVNYYNLFELFSSQERPLYYRGDSHWTMEGAQLAAESLLEKLGAPAVDYDALKNGGTEPHTGDLYEMVYPSGGQTEDDPAYSFGFEYLGNFRTAEDITIHTSNSGAQGSIFVYRDSFGINLHPFVAEAYGSACFSRAMPYKLSSVTAEQPDTLLVEIVERNLDWLIERAPEMPSPERELAESTEASDTTLAARLDECGIEGYTLVAGDLGGIAPDDDSPVYILAGDKAYEAFPSGDGEAPFTAYIPADEAQGELAAAVRVDGRLVAYGLKK